MIQVRMLIDKQILFGEIWDGVAHQAHKKCEVKVQMTQVHPHIQISPILNCVTSDSVSLAHSSSII